MNWSWAILIEGLMRRGETSTHPLGLVVADPPSSVTFPNGDVFGGTCPCIRDVRLSSMSVAPVSGEVASQTLSCEIDLRDEDVARFFFAEPSPVGVLTYGGSGVSLSTNQVPVTLFSGGAPSSAMPAGSVVYIGREAFRVASTGAVSFTATSTRPSSVIYPGAGETNDVTRTGSAAGSLGHGFTTMRAHLARSSADSPAPWQNDLVFVDNPSLKNRRVFLYRVGVNSAGQCIQQLAGQYRLDAETLSTGADGLTLSFGATSLVGSLQGAKINRRPVVYQLRISRGTEFLVAESEYGGITSLTDSLYYQPGQLISARAVVANGEEVGALCPVDENTTTPSLLFDAVATTRVLAPIDPASTFGGLVIEPAESVDSELRAFNEVLVSDPMLSARSSAASTYPQRATTHPYYSTEAPDPSDPAVTTNAILTHPLHIVLAHLGVINSRLPNHWKIEYGPESVDRDGILSAARAVFVPEWPGVVAGNDGKPIDALKWLYESFLRPLGWGWGVDQHGRLTVRSLLSPPSAITSEIGQTLALYGRAVQRSTRASADAVIASVGGGVGSAQVTVTGRDAYLPDDDDPSSSVYEIEARGALSPNAPTSTALDVPSVQLVRGYVSALGALLSKGARGLVITVTTAEISAIKPSRIYDLLPGELVTLTLRGLRGVSGLIEDDQATSAIVIQHEWSQNYSAQKITTLLLPYRLRRISASAVVTAVTDDGGGQFTLTVEADDTVDPVGSGVPYDSPFGSFSSDAATIEHQSEKLAGVNIEVSDQYLAAKGTAVFSSRSGNDIVVVGSTTTPVVGDWLTIGPLGDNASTRAESELAFFGRDEFTL